MLALYHRLGEIYNLCQLHPVNAMPASVGPRFGTACKNGSSVFSIGFGNSLGVQ
jgi:hypothetical protein